MKSDIVARRADRRAVMLGAAVVMACSATGCVKPTERPFLWMIEGARPSFLYGTIHLPDARVLVLPEVVEDALHASDAFYAELALDQNAGRQLDAATCLPAGMTLRTVLSTELYARTDRYFRSKGISLAALDDRKVWFIAATAGALDYLPDFILRPPLDQQLWDRARWRGLERGGLETLDEQLAVFEELTPEEQVQQLDAAITAAESGMEQGRSVARQLVDIYLAGDDDALLTVLMGGEQSGAPEGENKLLDRLVGQRNIRLTERIAARLRENPERGYFFAVGAGHLVGQDGIVARLGREGYALRRLVPGDEKILESPRERR